MPLVKIEMASGKSSDFKEKLIAAIGDSVVESLKVPEDDRNVRLLEYEKNQFIMKKPYEYLIEITLFKGRTREIKNNLYKTLVQNLENRLQISKDQVFIVLNEQPLENWGIRGGVSAETLIKGSIR